LKAESIVSLSDSLRRYVLDDTSISAVARATGVPQSTLQEFAVGKADGTLADLRLSSAERLIEYYGVDADLVSPSRTRKGRQRMLLVDELTACECHDSPEKFRERLIDGLTTWYPGRSIDDLVCKPVEALGYCNQIREGVGSDYLYDVVILKSLLNIRKRKDCPTGLKLQRRRRVVKRELKNAGCQLEARAFKGLVGDCLADMYKSQTVDELVCHPREARALCNFVRRRLECEGLGDELILSTLMNNRKSPDQ
jgi:hypothetical protein